MHHELTPLTPEEVVVEIPDGSRSDEEWGDAGDTTGGGMMAGVQMGGVGCGGGVPMALLPDDGRWSLVRSHRVPPLTFSLGAV